MNILAQVSYRGTIVWVGAIFFTSLFQQSAGKASAVTVGDPARAGELPAALAKAYANGARDITIAPGEYRIPDAGKNSFEWVGWRDVSIHANNVSLIFADNKHRPLLLKDCANVLLEGATLQFSGISYTQGRIVAIGAGAQGKYIEWRIDAGYQTNIDPTKSTFNVIEKNAHMLKLGTGDSGAQAAETFGPGHFKLRRLNGKIDNAAVNDWLVTRAPGGSSLIQLAESKHCTMKEITLKNSGFAAFFETGGDGGHHYVGCHIARGPKPAGATEEQLVSCGADGFHSVDTRIGPTIEDCTWDGFMLDDCIAIHGGFQKALRAEGTKVVLEKGNHAQITVGDLVRFSNAKGYFEEAKCIGLKTLAAPERQVEVTLDHALPVPADAKASNPNRCGRGYKIVRCTLGNTRSRGILVKGDDGLIDHCKISYCGMSAVSIGPEYWWNEADYCTHVVVTNNTFLDNDLCRDDAGVVFIHGDGAIGNRDIAISNNRFEESFAYPIVNVQFTDGATIANNRFERRYSLPRTTSLVNLENSRTITLKSNVANRMAANSQVPIRVGKYVYQLQGNDDSGLRIEREGK